MSTLPHVADIAPAPASLAVTRRVAWLSLASACLAWMFDSMDLNLFTLVLFPSVSELIGSRDPGVVAYTGGIIVAIKLAAWGLGGIAFGVAADRIGRSRTMVLTVLIYSVFTAASAFAQSGWQLALCQALAGIGIGGEWAAGAALVAETWPERTRPRALVVMQMSFAGGYFLAALLNLTIGPFGWRYVFLAGAVPAVLTLFVRQFVPEPQRWVAVRRSGSAPQGIAATFLAIFAPGMRRRTIVGVTVAAVMMIGTWGSSVLIPTWIRQMAGPAGAVTATSEAVMLANIGAVLGYAAVIWLNDAIGRRRAYFVMVLGSLVFTLAKYATVSSVDALLWFMPFVGFFTIGGYGTFAAYLPELFPTRIRATGQGFCWNLARTITALGPFVSGTLVAASGSIPRAGAMVALVFVVGLVAIWFGPETRGQPLAD